MPWIGNAPNQSFQRTDGTRTGNQTWQEADASGINIVSPDHDIHDQDIADGLTQALKRDGGNTAVANIPMGGFRFTNLGDASALTQATTIKQTINAVGQYCAVSGSANAITLTTGFSITAYATGQTFSFKVASANTDAVTVNVDGCGVKSLVRSDGANTALVPGDLRADALVEIQYDGTRFQLRSQAASGVSSDVLARMVRAGSLMAWAGTTAPGGWLECYGQSLLRTDYPELFAEIGTTFGAADGTHFSLPDLRGRSIFGEDDMGGLSADRITSAVAGFDGDTLGASGGAQSVTLAQPNLPNATLSGTTNGGGSHFHYTTADADAENIVPLTGSNFLALTGYSGSQNSNNYLLRGDPSTPDLGRTSTEPNHTHPFTTSSINGNVTQTAVNKMPPGIILKWIILASPTVAAAGTLGVNGYQYNWNTATSGDPGSGFLRANNATLSSATAIAISETDGASSNLAALLATWDDSTSTVKGHIQFFKVGAPGTFAVFAVSGSLTDNGSYDTFTVTHVASNGTFSNGDSVSVLFHRTGDKGEQGDAGPPGSGASPIFATLSEAAAYDPDVAPSYIMTSGYSAAGDGGGALYKQVVSEPTHIGKVQIAEGTWYEISENCLYAEMLGAVADYDPSDGSGTDNGSIINAAFEIADVVYLRGGYYKTTETVVVPPYCVLSAYTSGYNSYAAGFNDDYFTSDRMTFLVPRGHARVHTLNFAYSQCELYGGVLANPDSAHAYTTDHGTRLDFYRTIDFSNQDAVGATPATPRAFSAALKMGRGSRVENIGIRTTDVSGAFDVASGTTNWGDEIDVGIYALNVEFGMIRNCPVTWSFRDAGVLIISDDETGDVPDYYPQVGKFLIDGCLIEGHASLAIRGPDIYRISDVAASELRVTWSPSHRFPSSGSLTIGGVAYAYTSLTFDGGNNELVFGTVTPNPSGVVNIGDAAIRTTDNRNFGTGGVSVINSFIKAFTHASLRGSTDDFFAVPREYCARLMEIAGQGCRGIHFQNTYFHSREDIFFWIRDAADVYFNNCYHEAKSFSSSGVFYATARCIALSTAALVARGITEAIGDAGNIHFTAWSQTESGTDMRPTFSTTSNYGRFGTGTTIDDGLFEPLITSNDAYDWAGGAGTTRDIRFPATRGTATPFRVLAKNNSVRALFDSAGRMGIGTDFDADTDLIDALTVSNGSSTFVRARNRAGTGATGFVAENTAGTADFRVNSLGRGEIRSSSIARMQWAANFFGPSVDNTMDLGSASATLRMRQLYAHGLVLVDGVTAPGTVTGHASIYVDSADGDLKIKFADGTVKTIVTDT